MVALAALPPARTLDVACGTGFLTRHLPGELTGLDQSAGMLDVAAARIPRATFVQGDALDPPFGPGAFERVHASHFYGHLLAEQRGPFLDTARRLAGELVIVDSALRPGGGAESWQERELNDGSRHRVYKRWFTAERSRRGARRRGDRARRPVVRRRAPSARLTRRSGTSVPPRGGRGGSAPAAARRRAARPPSAPRPPGRA